MKMSLSLRATTVGPHETPKKKPSKLFAGNISTREDGTSREEWFPLRDFQTTQGRSVEHGIRQEASTPRRKTCRILFCCTVQIHDRKFERIHLVHFLVALTTWNNVGALLLFYEREEARGEGGGHRSLHERKDTTFRRKSQRTRLLLTAHPPLPPNTKNGATAIRIKHEQHRTGHGTTCLLWESLTLQFLCKGLHNLKSWKQSVPRSVQ